MAPDPDPQRAATPSLVTRLADLVEGAAKAAQIVLFAGMIAAVFYEVVMRYVFNQPTLWSEELARLAMVWLVVIGMSLAVRHREHIRVDFFLDHLPPAWCAVLGYLRIAAVFGFALVLLVSGWQLADMNRTQISPGLGLPVFWKYLAVPVSAAALILFLVELLRRRDARPF